MSVIGSVVSHAVIRSASDAFWSSQYQKWRPKAESEAVEYYMSFVVGSIVDENEREFIKNQIIIPKIQKMTENQLGKVLKIRDKNNKLIKKNKPIKVVLINDDDLRNYHSEYLSFKKRKMLEIAMIKKQQKEEAEIRTKNARNAVARKRYIAENGESDAEIAAKFF